LSRGHQEQLGLELASSRRKALGLLHRSAFKKPAKLVADLSPLRNGWHWHRLEEYCRHSDILASPSEDKGLIAPLIILDAAIDVTTPALGCSAVTLARALLLEGGLEVHQLLAVLVDLGFSSQSCSSSAR
jgi:hypothetical protein